MFRINLARELAVCSVFTLLAACNSGSSNDGGDDNSPQTLTATLNIPFSVEGLSYQSGTQSGTTDVNGQFSFRSGEEVVFQLGNLEVGRIIAEGGGRYDLFDLVNGAVPLFRNDDIVIALRTNNAFRQVVNLNTLLYSLDYDQDHSNGIQISNHASDSFSDYTIDLRVYPQKLKQVPALESILSTLDYQNGDRTKIISPAIVMDFAYNDYSENGPFSVSERLDTNSPNGGSDVLNRYNFESGKLISASVDIGIDNTINHEYRYQYDDNGFLLSYETDFYKDGEIDSKKIYERDADGVVSALLEEVNGDGVIDRTDRYTYVDGNLDTATIDYTNESSIDLSRKYHYDQSGRRTLVEFQHNINGTIYDNTLEYVYDASGNVIEKIYTYGYQGFEDFKYMYNYDVQNRLVSEYRLDLEDDSRRDYVSYEYGANGLVAKYFDSSGAGDSFGTASHYELDANGNKISYTSEIIFNGTRTLYNEWTYTEEAGWSAVFDIADEGVIY